MHTLQTHNYVQKVRQAREFGATYLTATVSHTCQPHVSQMRLILPVSYMALAELPGRLGKVMVVEAAGHNQPSTKYCAESQIAGHSVYASGDSRNM